MNKKALLILSILLFTTFSCSSDPEKPKSYKADQDAGLIQHPSGVSIDIPEDALSGEQEITVTLISRGSLLQSPEFALEYKLVGDYYEIETEQEIFDKPVTIVLPYDESMVPEGRNEGEIYAAFFYEGEWHKVLGHVDAEKNQISIVTYHASLWTVMMDVFKEINYGLAVRAYRCIESILDPVDVPKNKAEADALLRQRQQEFYDTFLEWDYEMVEAEEAVWEGVEFEVGLEISVHIIGEIITILGPIPGYFMVGGVPVFYWAGPIIGAIHLGKLALQSGDAYSAAYKLEYAYQNMMAAYAFQYYYEHGDNTNMPYEYASGIIGICDIEEEAPKPEFPNLDFYIDLNAEDFDDSYSDTCVTWEDIERGCVILSFFINSEEYVKVDSTRYIGYFGVIVEVFSLPEGVVTLSDAVEKYFELGEKRLEEREEWNTEVYFGELEPMTVNGIDGLYVESTFKETITGTTSTGYIMDKGKSFICINKGVVWVVSAFWGVPSNSFAAAEAEMATWYLEYQYIFDNALSTFELKE